VKRFHFTIVLTVTLTGCTCFAPLQAPRTASKIIAGSEKAVAVKKKSVRQRTAANTRKKIVASPAAVKTPPQQDDKSSAESKNSVATKVETPQLSQLDDKSSAESKNSVATKVEIPQPSPSDGKSNADSNMKSTAAKTEAAQSSQLDDEVVIKKARVTIAAKMDNPVSVVFLDMKRAARKDALGNSVDTICGRVRGKLAGDAGDRPFLYVVQKDEAYVGAYALATGEYRNICN
jgi:hypothetical protein